MRNAQREGTLVVRLDQVLAGIVHGLAVQLERYARHGDAGVAVIDVTRVNYILVLVEVVVSEHIAFGAERDFAATCERLHVASDRHIDFELAFTTVFQSFLFIVARVVGEHLVLCAVERLCEVTLWCDDHLHASHPGAVGHAYITAHHCGRFAIACFDIRADDVYTFTLRDALHHVVVHLLYIHLLVLNESLLDVVGNGVRPCSRAMVAAQYAVEVALATRRAPVQHHAALLGGGSDGIKSGQVHIAIVQ